MNISDQCYKEASTGKWWVPTAERVYQRQEERNSWIRRGFGLLLL